jgi:hypothetical protein
MMHASKRASKLVIFGVSAAVASAVAILTYQPIVDAPNNDRAIRTVEPAVVSSRCQESDRATVAQLAAFLERNRPADAPILERAIDALNMARRHCRYEWDGRGLDDYQWLSRWLSEHS